MQSKTKPAKIALNNGCVLSPVCQKVKLLRLPSDGRVRAYVYCRNCHRERFLNIDLSLSQ